MTPSFDGADRNTECKRQGAPGEMPAAWASVRECPLRRSGVAGATQWATFQFVTLGAEPDGFPGDLTPAGGERPS